ncbi:putative proton-coupled amino acid transporter 1 [Apostichopus japonicus]|uniref:Putative proton-coupled amino acid transporter 1 n=1 Tax=Stichopus japonicus TaxID=307972 RepID=A0A2G8KML4_STIJA|nr:putative proton-coupled amino acid transporter 1 [Apostichopus japonicus]
MQERSSSTYRHQSQSLTGYVSSRLRSISESELERTISYGEVARAVLGRLGSILTTVGLFVTQFGFCVSYFIFIADTLEESIDTFVYNRTKHDIVTPTAMVEDGGLQSSVLTDGLDRSWWQYLTMGSNLDKDAAKHVVDYHLLLLIPFPCFMALAMLKRIRDMGPFSALANFSVLVGFITITVIIFTDFKINNDVTWTANFSGFPIFFGQVTSAYEGIGTIIPIETSMEGNRSLYPVLLYGALLLFTGIYCFMGVIGYLKYGNNVGQVLIWSLAGHTNPIVILMINATICIGVLFTYPLQNFVAVEIVEGIIFGKSIHEDEQADTSIPNGESREPLLSSGIPNESVQSEEVVTRQPTQKVPFYKRGLVRAVIVVIQFGLAYFLKDSYAYFSALVGAVGSTMLAYVIPCLIHIRLGGRSTLVIMKDVLLISIGLVGMVTGVYFSVRQIIENLQGPN